MTTSEPPAQALKVTTYDEFAHFVHQFALGHYYLLMLIGDPGLAKSQTVQRAIGNRPHVYIETHATAFGMYRQLYAGRDQLTVIDDVDHLYSDRGSVRLLKSLCNTDKVKTLRWLSRHPDIGDSPGQIPREFTTTSRVCLIANQWRTLNANVLAIEDRAIIVHFVPSVGEVHVKVREWFDDREVYDFIEDHLADVRQLSMRHYVKGEQLKKANPDKWQEQLLTIMGIDDQWRSFIRIVHDTQLASEAERVARFESEGLGDRATYYRWKKKLPGE